MLKLSLYISVAMQTLLYVKELHYIQHYYESPLKSAILTFKYVIIGPLAFCISQQMKLDAKIAI